MSVKTASVEKVLPDPEITSVAQDNIYRPDVDTSGVDERKLLRRMDWHTVPWLALLYFLNSLDRGNIGNAKVSPFVAYVGSPALLTIDQTASCTA